MKSDYTKTIENNVFEVYWNRLSERGLSNKVKKNFVKKMFPRVVELCRQKLIRQSINPLDFNVATSTLEFGRILEQIYCYHLFYTSHLEDYERVAMQDDEKYQNELISLVSGNILVGNLFEVYFDTMTSKNSPEILVYKIFANRILSELNLNINGRQMRVSEGLIVNIMGSIKGVVDLLAEGQGSSAVSIWRHLHEQECALLALFKGGNPVIEAYWSHMRFNDLDTQVNNPLTLELKAKLAEYEMDKPKHWFERNKNSFINYGWLLADDDFKASFKKKFTLNFKSLQSFVGMGDFYSVYSDASKVAHSSGIMLASTTGEYYIFVMSCLYNSVKNLSQRIIDYIKLNYTRGQNELEKFLNASNRDLEQMDRNHKVLEEKYEKMSA